MIKKTVSNTKSDLTGKVPKQATAGGGTAGENTLDMVISKAQKRKGAGCTEPTSALLPARSGSSPIRT
jgi:hypothetical protein